MACQFAYGKGVRWIWAKKLQSLSRLHGGGPKFLKISHSNRIVIFVVLAEIFISTVASSILVVLTSILLHCQIIREGFKNKPDLRSNQKLRLCVIQGNIVLSFVFPGWGLGFQQIHGLLMYTYNFHFLCFAHGVLACIVNFYQKTDGQTDRWTSWDIEVSC